jgi:hypothetical protein
VLKDGCEFEQMMMMEQQGRPEFAFLFDLESPEHVYYRWRLYSLAGEQQQQQQQQRAMLWVCVWRSCL